MNLTRLPIRALFAGLYAWLAALFLGATYLDIRYSRLLDGLLAPAGAAALFAMAAALLAMVASATTPGQSWRRPGGGRRRG
jgi:hypothetical protein